MDKEEQLNKKELELQKRLENINKRKKTKRKRKGKETGVVKTVPFIMGRDCSMGRRWFPLNKWPDWISFSGVRKKEKRKIVWKTTDDFNIS